MTTEDIAAPEDAWNAVDRAYRERDRAALEFRAHGGQVVGCLGADVPEEMVIAAGMLPVQICGDPALDLHIADDYIEGAFDPHVRSQFARIALSGVYDYLDHLVVSSSSDALVRVFYYLRALRVRNPALSIPDLYCLNLVHSRVRSTALFNRDRMRAFRRVIEEWCGAPITDDALAYAISLCKENAALWRQLAALRAPGAPRVRGIEALKIIGASLVLPREEFGHRLRGFLDDVANRPPFAGVRLFVTGSPQDHPYFYELVEECGAVIIGEDHDWGNRRFDGTLDPTADPIDAIVDRYHLRSPAASRASISARVSSLVNAVRAAQAEGVIAFIYHKDDAPSWDFPEQRRVLDAEGIPTLLIDNQPYPMGEKETLRSQMSAFVQSIAARQEVKR